MQAVKAKASFFARQFLQISDERRQRKQRKGTENGVTGCAHCGRDYDRDRDAQNCWQLFFAHGIEMP